MASQRGHIGSPSFKGLSQVLYSDLPFLHPYLSPIYCQICDFNLSRAMPVETKMLVKSLCDPNSPAWSSPEVLSFQDYSFSSDVYSFGVLMWAMLTLKEPWKEECIKGLYNLNHLFFWDDGNNTIVPITVKVGPSVLG